MVFLYSYTWSVWYKLWKKLQIIAQRWLEKEIVKRLANVTLLKHQEGTFVKLIIYTSTSLDILFYQRTDYRAM